METKYPDWRDIAITAIAPITWGTTYVITKEWLPANRPLFSAVVRVLPVGLVLLALRRTLPRGDWWWRAAVLGMLNFGAFFALLYLGAYLLPGGLASVLQSTGPLLVIGLAAWLLSERIRPAAVAGALLGVGGVALLLARAPSSLSWLGVAAALGSVALSGLGFVLVKKWHPPVDLLTLVSWQLVAGGLFLVPLAWIIEGPPPSLDLPAIAGYLWLGVLGTGVAYWAWFRGLRRMDAGVASLIGLVNPVVAVALGVVVSGEAFGFPQALGSALVLIGVLIGQPAVTARFARRKVASPVQT